MSRKKEDKDMGENLYDGFQILKGGLLKIWATMHHPKYGWLVSLLVGFLLGVLYWALFKEGL